MAAHKSFLQRKSWSQAGLVYCQEGGEEPGPPQVQGERVSLLITLTLDPHMTMLEAGTLLTYNLSNTLEPRKDVCLEQTMLVPFQLG